MDGQTHTLQPGDCLRYQRQRLRDAQGQRDPTGSRLDATTAMHEALAHLTRAGV